VQKKKAPAVGNGFHPGPDWTRQVMYTPLSTNQQAEKRQWTVAWETMGVQGVSLRAIRPVFPQFDPCLPLSGVMKLTLCRCSDTGHDFPAEETAV